MLGFTPPPFLLPQRAVAVESGCRITGGAVGVYDPDKDCWIYPGGNSRTLIAVCLFTTVKAAEAYVEQCQQDRHVVIAPVGLAVDIHGVKAMESAFRKAHPLEESPESLFRGVK